VVLGAAGVAVFTIGVVVACLRLPEWRNRNVPGQSFFAASLRQIAVPAGLDLESEPRMQLRSKGVIYDNESLPQRETAYDILGPRAAEWLTREGRGPFIEAAAQSRWRTGSGSGQLRVLFSTRGVPVSAMWIPEELFRSSSTAAARRVNLDQLLVPAGQRMPEVELNLLAETVRVMDIRGSAPPETLLGMSIQGTTAPIAQRFVGPAGWWRSRIESVTLGSLLTAQMEELIVRGGFTIAVLILFVVLLVRRRIELKKGAVLAAFSIALSLPGPLWISTNWIQVADSLNGILTKAVALFVVWSAAESWLRSTVPGFRTSLDTLRAGRLGPKGGKALLAGWSIGAAVAGLWLLALSAGTMVPGVATTDGSIRLPVFGVARSPID